MKETILRIIRDEITIEGYSDKPSIFNVRDRYFETYNDAERYVCQIHGISEHILNSYEHYIIENKNHFIYTEELEEEPEFIL